MQVRTGWYEIFKVLKGKNVLKEKPTSVEFYTPWNNLSKMKEKQTLFKKYKNGGTCLTRDVKIFAWGKKNII